MLGRGGILLGTVCLTMLLSVGGLAVEAQAAEGKKGTLECQRIEGSGLNLIIHSSADVRCEFTDNQGSEQWYMGETGIALGLDLRITEIETLILGVLASTEEFVPEGNFLSGNYAGARADVAVGIGGGVSVLVGGSRDTIALEPAVQGSTGFGAGAGIGYLNLEPDPLSLARVAVPSGDLFSQVLYSAYFDRGYTYRKRSDYDASDFFSEKAMQSANGTPPAISDAIEGRQDTREARIRLETALARYELAAPEAARAQAGYDCWVHALKRYLPNDAEACQSAMLTDLTALEAVIAEYVAVRAQEATIKERAAFNLSQRFWTTVFFPTDSSTLNRSASFELSKLAERLGDFEDVEIVLSGSADKIGSNEYNLKLSGERVASVKAALLALGVEEGFIASETAYGEENPVLEFQRNPVDAWSRRVDISVQPAQYTQEALEREIERISVGG